MKDMSNSKIYRESMWYLTGCKSSEENKQIISSAVAALHELYPSMDIEPIYKNLYNLKSVNEIDMKRDDGASGVFNYLTFEINIDKKADAVYNPHSDKLCKHEVLIHEAIHCMENGIGHNGVYIYSGGSKEYCYVNEVFTQYKTAEILNYLELDYTKDAHNTVTTHPKNLNEVINVESPMNGDGYDLVNFMGKALTNIDPENLTRIQFSGGTGGEFSDDSISKYIGNSLTRIDDELKEAIVSDNTKELVKHSTAATEAGYQMLLLMAVESKDLAWDDFADVAHGYENDIPAITTEHSRTNIIDDSFEKGDIIMWAKTHDIPLDKIDSELSKENRQTEVNDFVNCCKILRQTSHTPYEDVILDSKFSKTVSENGTENYAILVDGKMIKKSIDHSNNSVSIVDDSGFIPSPNFKSIGFSLDTVKDNSINFDGQNAISEIDNGNAFYHSMALRDSQIGLADLYAVCGNSKLRKSHLTFHYSEPLVAASTGNLEKYMDNISEPGRDTVRKEMIEHPLIIEEALKHKEYDFMTYNLTILSRDNKDVLQNVDIAGINNATGENVLCELMDRNRKILTEYIENHPDMINLSEGKNSLASKITEQYTDEKLNINVPMRWYIENGGNLQAQVKYHFQETDFQYITVKFGKKADFQALIDSPDFDVNHKPVNMNSLLDASVASNHPFERTKNLIEMGIDINSPNYKDCNAGHLLIRQIQRAESPLREEMKETLGLLIDNGLDTTVKWDNCFTVAEQLAENNDPDLIIRAMQHGVKCDDIFTEESRFKDTYTHENVEKFREIERDIENDSYDRDSDKRLSALEVAEREERERITVDIDTPALAACMD